MLSTFPPTPSPPRETRQVERFSSPRGDLETLLAVARGVGLEQEKLRSTFTGDAFLEEVAQSQRRAGALGVSGVPLYVLGGSYRVSGAQPVAVFSEALAAAISNPATE